MDVSADPASSTSGPGSPESRDAIPIGTLVDGRYRVLEFLGAGGMGCVHRVYDEVLLQDRALKTLRAGDRVEDPEGGLLREAQNLARLEHPHLCRVFDFGQYAGRDYVVMEYIPGDSADLLLRRGPVPERKAIDFGIQMLEGLAAAHRASVLHLDLKPGNVRISQDGRLKIVDFGLSQAFDRNKQPRASSGSLRYLSPEQLQGLPVDARTDLRAAGLVLFELATGSPWYPDSDLDAVCDAVLTQPIEVPETARRRLSLRLQRILLRALQVDPNDRYATAEAFLADLQTLQRGRRLRGISALSGLAAVIALGMVIAIVRPIPPRAATSLAILPFAFHGSADQSSFAEGLLWAIHEELVALGPRVEVKGLRSSERYRDTHKDDRQIGRELGVSHLLTGMIARLDTTLRITMRCTRTRDDREIWVQHYDVPASDAFRVQHEVAVRIAATFTPGSQQIARLLFRREEARAVHRSPPNGPAYEAYVAGLGRLQRRTENDLGAGILYLERATTLDSTFASAYAHLADAYLLSAAWEYLPAMEAFAKARKAAESAVALDSLSAEAYTALATVHQDADWRWSQAAAEFGHALELNAGYVTTHQRFADLLADLGRLEQAQKELERARSLDPLNAPVVADLANVCYLRRDPQKALQLLNEAIELEPDFAGAYDLIGEIQLDRSDRDAAAAAFREALRLRQGDPQDLASLAEALADGRRGLWLWRLRRLEEVATREYTSPFDFARAYAALGELEKAFLWLARACDERDPRVARIKIEPTLSVLRSDARYAELVRRVGLPPD